MSDLGVFLQCNSNPNPEQKFGDPPPHEPRPQNVEPQPTHNVHDASVDNFQDICTLKVDVNKGSMHSEQTRRLSTAASGKILKKEENLDIVRTLVLEKTVDFCDFLGTYAPGAICTKCNVLLCICTLPLDGLVVLGRLGKWIDSRSCLVWGRLSIQD